MGVCRGHTNPPHPHTSDLMNLNDLDCNEESSVLRAFSELLHLINSNFNLLDECRHSAKGGAVETGCSCLYYAIYTDLLHNTTPIHCTPSHCTPLCRVPRVFALLVVWPPLHVSHCSSLRSATRGGSAAEGRDPSTQRGSVGMPYYDYYGYYY